MGLLLPGHSSGERSSWGSLARPRGLGWGCPCGPPAPLPPVPPASGSPLHRGRGAAAAQRRGPDPARRLPPPPHPPMRTRRCLRRVSGSLRVSSTFCVDFRTSPCGFLENIPPGPAPAPRSRGGQRPPDPPAPGPLHSRRQRQQQQQQRRLLFLRPPPPPPPGRRGWRGPAGAGPGLGSPFLPPSLALLPLLHDSRQVRPRPSLWQPRRDVTVPEARRAEACGWAGRGGVASCARPGLVVPLSLPTPAVLCGSVKSRREHGQKMQAKHAVAKAVAPSLLSVKPQLSSSRICLTAPPAMPALGLLQLLTAAPARHHLLPAVTSPLVAVLTSRVKWHGWSKQHDTLRCWPCLCCAP